MREKWHIPTKINIPRQKRVVITRVSSLTVSDSKEILFLAIRRGFWFLTAHCGPQTSSTGIKLWKLVR